MHKVKTSRVANIPECLDEFEQKQEFYFTLVLKLLSSIIKNEPFFTGLIYV